MVDVRERKAVWLLYVGGRRKGGREEEVRRKGGRAIKDIYIHVA